MAARGSKKAKFVTEAAATYGINRKLVGLIVDEWERARKKPAAKKAPAKRKAAK